MPPKSCLDEIEIGIFSWDPQYFAAMVSASCRRQGGPFLFKTEKFLTNIGKLIRLQSVN